MGDALRIDQWLFHFINGDLSNPVLDASMPVLTDLHKSILAVCLVSIAVLFWLRVSRKKGIQVLLLVMLTVAFTDIGNHHVIKPIFGRLRPQFALESINLRAPSLRGYSFPSNHVLNCFAAATVVSSAYPAATLAAYAIGLIVAFSRVYVGVHFPLDVVGAALFGILVGKIFWWVGKSKINRSEPVR